ncbi:hypothetical protein [Capnocytophaga leadbetteri]|uniref:hypothetical protein n=1 Tax=Capnocytophaga leadbetteri TaxID=327575 RepID=UPI0026EE0E77|nr:hypothetical protein [Capnocytophaga leadbetteri]
MKEQVTTLELDKCYRVKYESISWCIRVYEEFLFGKYSSLTAIRVDNSGINTRELLMPDSYQDSKYNVQEISNSEFMHEFRAKRNEINKLIKKMS